MNSDLVKRAFSSPEYVEAYARAVDSVGLWESERIVFSRHLPRSGPILEVGCGTGRVALGLYEQGYRNLEGVDFSPRMVAAAKEKAIERGARVRFLLGDALNLEQPNESFVAAVFAANGLMQIPGRPNRRRALAEICRVVQLGGSLVFTTHDRELGGRAEFWEEERRRWESGSQDPRLDDFGDVLFEAFGVENYIHIPDRAEVSADLRSTGWELVEDLWRPDICEESEVVREFVLDCRFWVARKT